MKKAALRYHGSKWRMADKIISLFPSHDSYIEPYAGAAAVLLNKPRAKHEIYNDMDNRIVNFFCAVREDESRLVDLIKNTPYSRTEFINARQQSDDRFEDARRIYVLSSMGFSSDACTRGDNTGFRSHPDSVNVFARVDHFKELKKRLQNVVIECMPALDAINKYDSETTLSYIDPPYVRSSRNNSSGGYRFEMSDNDHIDLHDRLACIKGFAVVSGYRSDLYDELYQDWESYSLDVNIQSRKGNSVKTEYLWISPSTKLATENRLI